MTDLHRDAIVVDCHNDLAEMLIHRPILGDLGSLRNHWIGELRAGGIDVQVMPVYAERSAELALRSTLRLIAAVHREVEESADDASLCLDGPSVRGAVADGKVAVILAMEGASALGEDPALVQLFFMLGVRMISFTHFGRTQLADGSAEDDTGSRLTRAGIAVLSEMQRLGILMDVTHLGQRGLEHVLELTQRPVIASHSVARAVHDHHRNLLDEHIAGIAGSGGVVCANAIPGFIDPANPTLNRMVDHIEHMVEVAGIDHVGLGADFCADLFALLYSPEANLVSEGVDLRQELEGFWTSRHTPRLTEVLLSRGFALADIRAILGENLLRIFDTELGVPAAGAS